MKQRILIGIIVLALAAIAAVVWFFRGAAPAILPPREDIADLLPSLPESDALPEAENRTEMPLTLPRGFSISIFAKDLGKPRVLAFDPKGTMLVSISEQGKIVALPDRDGNGAADETVTVVSDLNRPHGLAFRCDASCDFYIAESHRVAVWSYDAYSMRASNPRTVLDLPDGGNHWTRTIMFRPWPDDTELLVSVGSSCNVCRENDAHRAAILAFDIETGRSRTFASGLRNSVFMATHPVTGEAWATEMGRDLLGDDLPPDEINIVEEGKDYGWPFCYGKQVPDPFGAHPQGCAATTPSRTDIPAHSAPLGLAFIPEEGWPEKMWHDLLVAYHGSWNRSVPTGYKIVRYDFDAQGNVLGVSDFITGWLRPDGTALGRPVDILVQPGGVVYLSDDKAGVIYRLTYRAGAPTDVGAPVDANGCVRTGCSGQVCADEEVITTCEFRPEYACYRDAACERQANGACGWTITAALRSCLTQPPQ